MMKLRLLIIFYTEFNGEGAVQPVLVDVEKPTHRMRIQINVKVENEKASMLF